MPTALDLLSLLGPVTGGVLNGIGSSNATGALVNSTNQAQNSVQTTGQQLMQLYQQLLRNQRATLSPYEQVGNQNLETYNANVNAPPQTFSFNPSDLTSEPGYRFGLTQGENAIDAAGNAGGNRFSAGTAKALDRYAQDYAGTQYQQAYGRALSTFQENNTVQQQQLSREQGLAQMGEQAATTDVQAQGQDTQSQGNALLQTLQDTINLDTQRGGAQAAGSLGTTNAISGALQGVLNSSQGRQLLNTIFGGKNPDTPIPPGNTVPFGPSAPLDPNNPGDTVQNLPGSIGTIAGLGSAGIGAALSGTGAAAGLTPVTSVVIPGVTDALGAGAGAAAGTAGVVDAGAAAGATAAGATAGTGSLLGSVAGLLTNPWTIGIGGAILAGAALIRAFQVHPVADQFVQNYQNPFGQQLEKLVDGFDSAYQSGNLTKAQAQTIYTQTQGLIQNFMQTGQQFSTQGGKQQTVWNQAQRTMAQDFGGTQGANGIWNPDWSKILVKMQNEISGMQG